MAIPQLPHRPEQPRGGTLSRAALLHKFSAAYPEVSGPGVAHILDRAYLAAKLGTGTVDERIVAVLARDRLELLRARAAAARRTGAPAGAAIEPARIHERNHQDTRAGRGE